MLKSLLVAASLLLLLDPYSYGRIGGDEQAFTRVYWQVAFAAMSFCLLMGVVIGRSRLTRSAMSWTAVVEFAIFAIANTIYITRDGLDVRMFAGYEGSPVPLATVLLGMLVRVVALIVLLRDFRRQHDVTPAPS